MLSDKQILQLCQEKELLDSYVDHSVKVNEREEKIISYGLSSYGYDLRLADEFKVYELEYDGETRTIDPKNLNVENFAITKGFGYVVIPSNSFALGRSIEYIKMPRNVTGLATNKSTYARCGLNTPSTVLEAGWEGHLTIEMFNSTPHPIKVYSNEGIIQVLFFQGEDCLTSYSDRGGKYNGQRGITNAKV